MIEYPNKLVNNFVQVSGIRFISLDTFFLDVLTHLFQAGQYLFNMQIVGGGMFDQPINRFGNRVGAVIADSVSIKSGAGCLNADTRRNTRSRSASRNILYHYRVGSDFGIIAYFDWPQNFCAGAYYHAVTQRGEALACFK